MLASEFNSKRSVVGWQLETQAKKPFETVNKKGHRSLVDAQWVWVTAQDTIDGKQVTVQAHTLGMREGDERVLHLKQLNDYGYYTSWNSLEHLAKTASQMHGEFKNLWKWVLKTYPEKMRVCCPPTSFDFTPKDMYNFLRTDMVTLLALLMLDVRGELAKWTDMLKANNGSLYNPPISSMHNDPEIQ